ncbi:hypothetical protein PM082_022135 [Marasmius tenuissimus]|nr:hypothetical protein PM082_022135 [Marasmius tenuissimus]
MKRKWVDSLISEAPDSGPTLYPPPFEGQTGGEDGDEEAVYKTKKRRVTESREVEEEEEECITRHGPRTEHRPIL